MPFVETLDAPPELSLNGRVACVELRRPERANRLSVLDIETLLAHIETLHAHPEVRLVLLRAEGANFCAGFQIDAVAEVDAPALFERLVDAWVALRPISLALIQGGVWGGAVDLALGCDFRLGAAQVQMGIPAARLGLHFYGSGMQRLVSRLGLSAAKRLLLAAEVWQGEQLLREGFLDAQADDLPALAAQWQSRLLALAPLAQAGMKHQLNALAAHGALDKPALVSQGALCTASQDLAEGLAAWAERREPRFTGQ